MEIVYWANSGGIATGPGVARRGKLRRVSSGPGAEACCGGLTTGPGAAQQAQKGVFWAWRGEPCGGAMEYSYWATR